MLKILPCPANHVSVHPPLSIILIGATLLMTRRGLRGFIQFSLFADAYNVDRGNPKFKLSFLGEFRMFPRRLPYPCNPPTKHPEIFSDSDLPLLMIRRRREEERS